MIKQKTILKIKVLSLISIIALVEIDQIIKYFVVRYLKPVGSITLIDRVLALTLEDNDGGPLGLCDGKTYELTAVAFICIIVIMFVIFSGKLKFGLEYCCILLMGAGGIGNIIDRLFLGYVVDYIELLFVDFYIFNFADCLVTWSAVVMIFYQFYQMRKEFRTKKEKQQNG